MARAIVIFIFSVLNAAIANAQNYAPFLHEVFYDKLGLKFQTYDQWVASGAHVPAGAPVGH